MIGKVYRVVKTPDGVILYTDGFPETGSWPAP
jgi:hypothetical protein